MRWRAMALLAGLGGLLLLACGGGDPVGPSTLSVPGTFRADPVILTEQITADELPSTFDETRTYMLRPGQPQDAEILLRAMWAEGIRPARAWLPLDNRCMDPIGPRFTVELAKDDARIGDFGFDRGVGRLFCSTVLVRYTIVEPPGTMAAP